MDEQELRSCIKIPREWGVGGRGGAGKGGVAGAVVQEARIRDAVSPCGGGGGGFANEKVSQAPCDHPQRDHSGCIRQTHPKRKRDDEAGSCNNDNSAQEQHDAQPKFFKSLAFPQLRGGMLEQHGSKLDASQTQPLVASESVSSSDSAHAQSTPGDPGRKNQKKKKGSSSLAAKARGVCAPSPVKGKAVESSLLPKARRMAPSTAERKSRAVKGKEATGKDGRASLCFGFRSTFSAPAQHEASTTRQPSRATMCAPGEHDMHATGTECASPHEPMHGSSDQQGDVCFPRQSARDACQVIVDAIRRCNAFSDRKVRAVCAVGETSTARAAADEAAAAAEASADVERAKHCISMDHILSNVPYKDMLQVRFLHESVPLPPSPPPLRAGM